MKFLYTLLFASLFSACMQDKAVKQIIIQGDVKGIPDGKVYLTEAHKWSVYLDSADVKNGAFTFRISPDSSFYPFMASICYPDTTRFSKIKQLAYANEFVLPKNVAPGVYNYHSAFYLRQQLVNTPVAAFKMYYPHPVSHVFAVDVRKISSRM